MHSPDRCRTRRYWDKWYSWKNLDLDLDLDLELDVDLNLPKQAIGRHAKRR